MGIIQLIVLYIHIVAAIVFVGGSLFIYIALLPALRDQEIPEGVRNRVLVRATKRFGRAVDVSLGVLVLTGIYNATWYLGGFDFNSLGARILLAKAILVVLMIFSIYFNNLYYGRRISRTIREINSEQDAAKREKLRARLASTRRTSRVFSYLNLGLMLTVVLLAVMLQVPP